MPVPINTVLPWSDDHGKHRPHQKPQDCNNRMFDVVPVHLSTRVLSELPDRSKTDSGVVAGGRIATWLLASSTASAKSFMDLEICVARSLAVFMSILPIVFCQVPPAKRVSQIQSVLVPLHPPASRR